MPIIGLTKFDIEEAKLTIWMELCKGTPDGEIIDLTGLDHDTYHSLKRQLVEEKALDMKSKPPEHVYVEYVIAQTRNINDLTDMIKEFKNTKQYNAMVGAVKARADLQDKLISRGQELGVFKKMPDQKQIVAGVVVAEMTREDIKLAITNAVNQMNKMMTDYGDGDLLSLSPGELHYGPALPPATTSVADSTGDEIIAPPTKTVRSVTSKTSKAARGRRVR